MAASLIPLLSVRRGTQALAYYKSAFGAEPTFELGGEEEGVFAMLRTAEGVEFWVSDEAPDYQNFSPETVGGSTTRLVLVVDDPDAVFASAVAAGGSVVSEVTNAHGWRQGRVKDPFGHHWEISKPLD